MSECMPKVKHGRGLLVPFGLLFATFVVAPFAASLWLSLKHTGGNGTDLTMANYWFALRDRMLWLSAANTTLYAVVLLCIQIPVCLAIAACLHSDHARLRSVVKFALMCPYFIGPVFASVIFGAMLDTRHGVINTFMGTHIPFLTDPRLSMVAMVAVSLWLTVGFGSLYLAAAMRGIPKAHYDCARVDGAGAWGCFWHVTLPAIRPMLSFLIAVGTIQAFQLFELPYVLFGGPGPSSAGMTVVMYLYGVGFEAGDFGYASAVGWMVVIMLGALLSAEYLLLRRLTN